MNWRTAWAELWTGRLSHQIDILQLRCKEHENRWMREAARAELAAAMVDEAEKGRKAASDAMNKMIIEDMMKDKQKYLP